MPTDLVIRRASEEDLPAIERLARTCIDDMRHQGIDQWDDVYPTSEHFAADVAEASLWVACLSIDLIVGAVTLNQRQDTEYGAVSWSVPGTRVAVAHRLMVSPDAQNRGLGRRLMEFAERLAIAQGCDVMRLDAFSRNPGALQLYRSLFYREAGQVTFRKGAFTCFEKRLRAPPRAGV